jgi:hypothetical protein
MERTVIEKFLSRARKMRDIVPANQSIERFLPMQREPFQAFQETAV